MKEPTEAQIKEFWEWCGFERLPEGKKGFHFHNPYGLLIWKPPDATEWYHTQTHLPRIDLNNLFKYAVPKVEKDRLNDILVAWAYTVAYLKEQDPALALFWAIWEVFNP